MEEETKRLLVALVLGPEPLQGEPRDVYLKRADRYIRRRYAAGSKRAQEVD